MNNLKKIILIISILFSTNFSIAQDKQSPIFEIFNENGIYSGGGIDWLLKKEDSTQFYLFGEQHGVKGIPNLIGFIHKSLNKKKKYNLILEMDSWTCEKINKNGAEQIIKNYPHSIAFDNDDDIELIQGSESSIFGLDQMVTAIHPFQRLVELAPNEYARRLSQGAYLKASLKMGRYLRQPHFNDLKAIKNAFGNEISPEATKILEELQISMDIYVAYMSGQRGEVETIVSDKIREEYMISQFDNYLNLSNNSAAVIKMGGAHIITGIGPNNVPTLGNHVIEYSHKNNMNTISVSMFKYSEERSFLKPEVFKNTNTVLLDCKSYLEQLTDSTKATLTNSQMVLLKGYDGIILLNDASNSKKSIITHYEKTFKNQLINNLAIGGLLILFCLTSLVPLLVFLFSKSKKDENYKRYGNFLILFVITLIIVLGIFGIQISEILSTEIASAEITKASLSIWLFILLLLIGFYLLIGANKILLKNEKLNQKLYSFLISLSLMFLIGFMYYWNIGGMISI